MTMSKTDDASIQAEVFAFLTDPATHPSAQRIDTHAASVFLDGDRALKIKRAVRFPFLDYSTLARRKAACDAEITINRPFAPQIYRRVVAITRGEDGALAVDGNGQPVEYAVEMTRFDERQTIDHLAAKGPLAAGLADAMADTIAASHQAAPVAPAAPWIGSIPGIIAGNSAAFRAAACLAAKDVGDLEGASHAAFARLRATLERRGEQGYVRRCHGDLHLANIVLIADKPVLFDAIEFDDKIASVDVLYDLAFPLMDLVSYGRDADANRLFNRYLTIAAGDHLEALAALPLFLSMRAAIRANVLLARRDRPGTDGAEIVAAARRYFDLARSLIHPPAPMLIAVGGLSGTGKSVLARALAPFIPPPPGAVVLRSDVVRKQLLGVAETERLPASAYRPETGERIYRTLEQRAALIVAQGHSVVVDAVFARTAERTAIEDVARRQNVGFGGLFLTADLATRQGRISRRTSDASDATAEVAARQEAYDIGSIDWSIVDASGTPEATLARCQGHLAKKLPAR
jgi:aminoglycoside phosphotransferase family enzyme/predicted kinase